MYLLLFTHSILFLSYTYKDKHKGIHLFPTRINSNGGIGRDADDGFLLSKSHGFSMVDILFVHNIINGGESETTADQSTR